MCGRFLARRGTASVRVRRDRGEKRFHIPFRGRETDHAFLKGFSFGQRGSAIKDLDSTDMGCLLYLWQRAYDKK